MRIIIVQAEIELAIRQYVLGQINIAEGQEITIDFKNTRGDDGATAEINIMKPVPNEPVSQKPAQTTVQSRSTAPAKQIPATTASAVLAPAAAAGEAIASETEKSADSASTTSDQPVTGAQTSETSIEKATETLNQEEEEASSGFPKRTPEYDAGREEAIEAAEKAAEKPVTKPSFLNPAPAADAPAPASGKSLFANLTKPVNPKPAAEA